MAWARSSPDRAEVCADLRTGGPYERSLALTAALAAGADDEVRLALTDPVASIRARALTWAVRERTELDLDRPSVERRLIYRTLRAVPGPDYAEALLPRVRSLYGDVEAAALLPACGPELVAALLPELDHAVNLAVLARRHPAVLLAHVTAQLERADSALRARLWARIGPAVLLCDPAGVLTLLERFAPEDSLPGNLSRYGVLAAHDPSRVVALLAAPARSRSLWARLPRALTRRLVVLSDEELLPLARSLRDKGSYASLLAALPPRRRAAVHLRTVAPAGSSPDERTMELLPHAVRADEARKQLEQPWARGNEAQIRALSAWLPWPEARDAIVAATRSGDAEVRASAYGLLVGAARRSRDPQVVVEAFGLLDRLRNEQEPVRAAALTALARVAPLVTPALAERLTALTTDAVEARDVSGQSLGALGTLAAHVLQHHVDEPALREWALLTIDLATDSKAVPVLGRYDRTLRRGQEQMVFDRLRGWVEAGMARGFHEPLFALTRALGPRARLVPGLQALLRRAIDPGPPPSVARTAIALWLDDPRTRSDRTAELIGLDVSTVTVSPIWETVAGHRTDLLDRVLVPGRHGRFLPEGLRWAPVWPHHAERWLPRQQAAFVALQEAIAADTGAARRSRAAAIEASARVPVLGPAFALRYASSDDVVLAEAALGALVWSEQPDQAMATLLAHAGDDRARVAMYAAGRAVRFVTPSRLPGLLEPVLLGTAKVTSRKEAARLLGRFGPASSMGTLLAAYGKEGQHRDVRAAIVSAARGRLEAPESWAILEAGVRGSHEELQAVLGASPEAVAGRYRTRFAALVADAGRSADGFVRSAAFAVVPAWAPWIDDVTELVVGRLTAFDDYVNRWQLGALVATIHADGLDTLWQRLADQDALDTAGNAERDRPWRERLDDLTTAVVHWSAGADSTVDRGPALAAARSLAERAGFLTPALRMMVALGGLEVLDEVADRCAGRPIVAYHASRALATHLTSRQETIDPVRQLALAAGHEQRGDLARGLFAVALTQRGDEFEWPVEWRDRLRSLRQHRDPDVREAATSIVMSW